MINPDIVYIRRLIKEGLDKMHKINNKILKMNRKTRRSRKLKRKNKTKRRR